MFTSDFTAQIESRQRYDTYVAESARYRMMCKARQSRRQAPESRGYRLIERFGARLIALGKALCERRGTLAVEIAFHADHRAADHRPHGRHVA